jgi:hypothetical protein
MKNNQHGHFRSPEKKAARCLVVLANITNGNSRKPTILGFLSPKLTIR